MRVEVAESKIYCKAFENMSYREKQKALMLLSSEEKEKANAFSKGIDKERYILSHAYLRRVLSKHYPKVLPTDWEFTYNQYGKPFISAKHEVTLFFNLSHSRHYVAVILHDKLCGIDIEEDQGMPIDEGIQDIAFSQKEKYMYQKSSYPKEVFYQLWTLKEAYLKALGIGLQCDPSSIDFSCIQHSQKRYKKYDHTCATFCLQKGVYVSYAISH